MYCCSPSDVLGVSVRCCILSVSRVNAGKTMHYQQCTITNAHRPSPLKLVPSGLPMVTLCHPTPRLQPNFQCSGESMDLEKDSVVN
jgi:hypothetical protein